MKTRLLFLLCLTPILGFSQTQIGNDIDGEAAEDYSGWAVSLSDDGAVMAIGAHNNDGNGLDAGHVQIYQNDAGDWTQIGSNINGEDDGDRCGTSVSLSADGTVLAIGCPQNAENNTNSGYVKIYQNNEGAWTQVGANIQGEAAEDRSGLSVSLSADGSVVAISAPYNDGNGFNSGLVRMYQNNGNTWTQIGGDIYGEGPNDHCGYISLSADGTVVAIGCPRSNSNGFDAGFVRVFEFNAGNWSQLGANINGEAAENYCGNAVSISADGTVLAIGSPLNAGNGDYSGHVRIYEFNTGTWTQVGENIEGEASYDFSGTSVSLSADGSIVAIGAVGNSGNGNQAGHVRLYQNNEGTWTQIGSDIEGENAGDLSGTSTSISADGITLAIGAIRNDGNGENAGHVRVYDLSTVLSSDHFVQANFKVYPNPAADFVNVQLNEGLQLERVNVYSASGQLVKTQRNPVIQMNDLAKGTYILEVVTDLGKAGKVVVVE